MSEHGHDLANAFPVHAATLHRLKLENEHFRTLARRYHELSPAIFRMERDIAPGSDERLEELKKQRLALLDAIAEMIGEVEAAA